MDKQQNPILVVKNLEKSYGRKKVVSNISFEVWPGEIVGLLGPNGAGKTTAFYMAMGLFRPDKGTILFKNEDVTHFPIHRRAKMGMGYLAQEPSIFRSLTVEENILAILETLPLSRFEQKERLHLLLRELHLEHLAKERAISLSGGERRRLEITRSLATNPSFLLLDEPFANIDPLSIQEVKALIRLLAKKNISILITDHNAREIFSLVDRSYLIAGGEIFLSGTPQELMNNEMAKTTYLGDEFRM